MLLTRARIRTCKALTFQQRLDSTIQNRKIIQIRTSIMSYIPTSKAATMGVVLSLVQIKVLMITHINQEQVLLQEQVTLQALPLIRAHTQTKLLDLTRAPIGIKVLDLTRAPIGIKVLVLTRAKIGIKALVLPRAQIGIKVLALTRVHT